MKIPRGTFDITPPAITHWQWIENQARELCERYRYQEVRTPIFEQTDLFERGVGETTDVVEKEMYTFQDRGKRSLTLRPEGTAGLVRSYVENRLFGQPQLTKWFYMGPMFRYERPQAGRTRQFHQFGVEALGSHDPALDAEVISLGMEYFRMLQLDEITVEINNVGDQRSRDRYFDKLIAYFTPYEQELSADARNRLHRNPMRILDSKDPHTQKIAADAPTIYDFLDKESREHFETVCRYLEELQIGYRINERMVRGLDYYTLTAFEFIADLQGEQAGTVGGGGRYNGLVQEIGGADTPGIGFAIGLERILLALEQKKIQVPAETGLDCYFISMDEAGKQRMFTFLHKARQEGLRADCDFIGRKLKGQMKAANREQARYVIIFGEEEIKQERAQVKDMETGEPFFIPFDHLVPYLKEACQR